MRNGERWSDRKRALSDWGSKTLGSQEFEMGERNSGIANLTLKNGEVWESFLWKLINIVMIIVLTMMLYITEGQAKLRECQITKNEQQRQRIKDAS